MLNAKTLTHFEDILRTIGASDCKNLAENQHWDFWQATFTTPVQAVKGYYLALKHKCPLKEGDSTRVRQWRSLSNNQPYDVVITPRSHLISHVPKIGGLFGGHRVITTKKLVRDALLAGIAFKDQHVEQYFIEPDIEVDDEPVESGAVTYLTDWFLQIGKVAAHSKPIALLRADGGTGKTTVARALVSAVRHRNSRVFPLLIESEQWRFHVQSQLSLQNLWDIAISRILTRPGPFLANETAFRVLVKEGLFVIVFDGFDELCLHPQFGTQPSELINELLDQLGSEDESASTRILLTTRETYWETFQDNLDRSRIEQVRLLGFSNDQRRNYFHKRLKDPAQVDTALRYASQIGGSLYAGIPKEERNSDRMSGTPFVLDLIGQAVEGAPDDIMNPYAPDPLEELINAICKREDQRQTLGIDAAKQVALFEELFREQPDIITRVQLDEYVEIICEATDLGVKQRFCNHFFLTRLTDDTFKARYEILRVYFIARFLSRTLLSTQRRSPRREIAKILAESARGTTQILDWVVDQLSRHSSERVGEAILHARQMLGEQDNAIYRSEGRMALFSVVSRLIKAADKQERAVELNRLLSDQPRQTPLVFSEMVMTAQIKGYDFSNAQFYRCLFRDVEFKNCIFNAATVFRDCNFEGTVVFSACQSSEQIVWKGGEFSMESELEVDRILQRSSRLELRRKLAENVLERALRRFRGRFGFESIQFIHRDRGMPKAKTFDIWAALEHAGIVARHQLSSVGEGGLNIVDEPTVRREVMSFFDNRTLGPRLQRVIDEVLA